MNGYIIKYPGCIIDEVLPTIEALNKNTNLNIIDLTSVKSDLSADFLVLPGGSCDEAVVHYELHNLIRKTLSSNGIVAGICNGALVLASAGVLKNRKCTHTANQKYAPWPEFKELLEFAEKIFSESVYIDEDVVIDGNIITAKPHAAELFAEAIKRKLAL